MAARLIMKGQEDTIVSLPPGAWRSLHPLTRNGVEGPLDSLTLENAGGGGLRLEAFPEEAGPVRQVVIIGGDLVPPSTSDALHQRGLRAGARLHLHLLRQRAYMNTASSGRGPHPSPRPRPPPGGRCSTGNRLPKKNAADSRRPRAPYVATASIRLPGDFMQKVEKAVNTKGPCYVQGTLLFSYCTGWGFEGSQDHEDRKLAVETGLWVCTNDRRKGHPGEEVVRKPVE